MVKGGAPLTDQVQPAGGSRERGRKHRHKRKRKSRKQEKLLRNLVWLGGGLAAGLPLLAAMLYAMSR
jgi:hypothetical protein